MLLCNVSYSQIVDGVFFKTQVAGNDLFISPKNVPVVASVFNADTGELVKPKTWVNNFTLKIEDLPAGNYIILCSPYSPVNAPEKIIIEIKNPN